MAKGRFFLFFPVRQWAEYDYDTRECPDCEACGAALTPYGNDSVECSQCHAAGCYECMERGDDVFPWLCPGGCCL